jgi:hypothetical protein
MPELNGNNESKVHERSEPDAVVLHDIADVADTDVTLGGVAALVSLQPCSHIIALIFLEPQCLLGAALELAVLFQRHSKALTRTGK